LITLQRRYPSVNILLFPVLVQGKGAAPAIARAVEIMNERMDVDVLIVGRGGGSLEELWAFNEEIVARSIFASLIPVISAVGHETDFTICDFAADLRAATPTAAAELAVPHHLELKQQLHYETNQLQRSLLKKLQQNRDRLEALRRSPALSNPRRHLQQPSERLDRLKEQLVFRLRSRLSTEHQRKLKLDHSFARFNPREQVQFGRKRLTTVSKQLLQAMQVGQNERKAAWASKIRQLDALSPLKVMSRGYSLVYDEKGKKLINSISRVQPGDMVKIRLTDGKLTAHVWSMEENER
jgi:exodeoxyribonuclease VII large subunit